VFGGHFFFFFFLVGSDSPSLRFLCVAACAAFRPTVLTPRFANETGSGTDSLTSVPYPETDGPGGKKVVRVADAIRECRLFENEFSRLPVGQCPSRSLYVLAVCFLARSYTTLAVSGSPNQIPEFHLAVSSPFKT
jgi:hypothetical protein